MKLGTDATVEKAVRVASDMENNLPAVFPNYYRYAHVEETPIEETPIEETSIEETPIEEIPAETEVITDNSGLEIVEEEIEVDSEEESYDNVADAYESTYLNPGSGYYQWQHVTVGSTYAWNEGYTGSGVKVAVLDTGVSGNSDVTVAGNYEFCDSTTSTADAVGHGTHVAGIIGAKKTGTDGIGIAPDATLYNIKVLDDSGSGTDAQIMQGIRKAIELDVDLINMSLGGIGYNPIFQTVVDEAYNAGIAIFVSAGNDGGSNMCYPAAYKHIICVGATDNNNQRASFSNFGAWVDISAPGVSIWSTIPGNTYGAKSGTSMSCPVATGEAAVILSANPAALAGKTGGAKVDALEKLMKSNVVSAGSGMGKGITILTKVFKLSTAAAKPAAPVLKATVSADSQNVTVTIDAANDTTIYYTTNGKNPTYKNGVNSAGSSVYSAPLTLDGSKKITVSAIAVNDSGVCSAVKKITCTLKPYVQSITITGVSQIALGKSSQLKATVLPSYANNKNVTWSINAPEGSGVTISKAGKVTVTKNATSNKTYTVTATAKDGSGKTGTFPITVIDTAKIKSVKFTSTKLTLTRPNDTSYDMASLLDAKYVDNTAAKVTDFNWTSSNVKVATVSSQGVVTPLAPGTVTITATANDTSNKKATCRITIKQLATGLTITGNGVSGSTTIAAGKKITLKANVEPANTNNKNVTWSIDAPKDSGVTISKAGVVSVSSKATAKNYYTVTATTADGSNKTATYKVIVKSGIIKSVTMDKKSATIFRKAGSFGAPTYTTVTATLNGSEGFDTSAYTVKSSNKGIADIDSVSASGNVITIKVKATGKATGKTAVTVTSTDGSNKKATFNVTVNNPVSRINIAPTAGNSSYVAQGKSLQLKATLETEYGAVSNKNVTWSINASKESGVKISTAGKVTAAKTATAGTSYTVTATAKDGSGVYATYTVRISSPVSALYLYDSYDWGLMSTRYTWPIQQTPAPTTEIDAGRGAYRFQVIWSGSLYGGVTVSSSNPSVSSATVVSSGGYLYIYVSADKPGNATITVKANDGSGKQVKYKFKVTK